MVSSFSGFVTTYSSKGWVPLDVGAMRIASMISFVLEPFVGPFSVVHSASSTGPEGHCLSWARSQLGVQLMQYTFVTDDLMRTVTPYKKVHQ
jgi:hypothetical protein